MWGVLLGLTAAICWTLANAAIQPATRRCGEIGALLQTQASGGLLVIIAAIALEGAPGALNATGWLALLLGGVAALIAYLGLFKALARGSLSTIIPIISSWSIISVGVGVFVLDNEISTLQWTGIACAITGNLLLARSQTSPSEAPEATRERLTTMGLAAIAMLGFGLLVPATDVLGAQTGRLWAIPMIWTAELALGIMAWPVLRKFMPPIRLARNLNDVWIVSRAGVLEVGGFIAISLGIGLAPVALVAPAASLSSGLTVIWGVLVLREPLRPLGILGALVASVGVFLASS